VNKLTPKQQRFVEEYPVDLNGTQAAIRAGYSPKTAQQISEENLRKPVIREALGLVIAQMSEQSGIDRAWAINKHKSVAEFQLSDIGTFDGKIMKFKPETEWPDRARVAVRNIKQTVVTRYTKDGDPIETSTIELKIEPLFPAIEALSRHLNLFEDPRSVAEIMAELIDS
jgi:phage terminase small subunit